MYSNEIDSLIKSKNNLLTIKDYDFITDRTQNNQVNHIKYNPNTDTTLIETSDNFTWTVSIVA